MSNNPNQVNSGVGKSKLESALAWASRGFRVFPLMENSKVPPAGSNWTVDATNDPNKILGIWQCPITNSIADYNIGVLTDGYAVVDIDVKSGKQGLESFEGIGLSFDSLTVRTPTGGLHVYYIGDTANRTEILGKGSGLDIRGFHGYVVAPGSTIDGNAYEILHDREIGWAPTPLLPFLKEPGSRRSALGSGIAEDSEEALLQGRGYLLDEAPIAIEGQGGDDTTYKVCCKLTRDFGLTPDGALELLLEHWNPRCEPPWLDEDLQAKIEHAAQYGQNQIGSGTLEAQLATYAGVEETITFNGNDKSRPEQAPSKARGEETRKMRRQSFSSAVANALTDSSRPLIDGLLDTACFSVIYGDSNSGKTFVALDLAYHVAVGQSWNGKAVQKGLVVYVAAEGGHGIKRRLAALGKRHDEQHGEEAPSPLLELIVYPIDLTNQSNIQDLVALIKEAEKEYDEKCQWVIVDTLSRAMAGGDENSSRDMTNIVKAADSIREQTGAHFSFIHHTGKDAARGARGHSSLRAATDTEIEISCVKGNDGHVGEMRVTKQRDMDFGQPVGFLLVDELIGEDPVRKKFVTSAIVEWRDLDSTAGHRKNKMRLPAGSDELLSDLGNLLTIGVTIPYEGGHMQVIPEGGLRKEFLARRESKDSARKQFARAKSALVEKGQIASIEHGGNRYVGFKKPMADLPSNSADVFH